LNLKFVLFIFLFIQNLIPIHNLYGYSWTRSSRNTGPPMSEEKSKIWRNGLIGVVLSTFVFLLIYDNCNLILLYRLKSKTKEILYENDLSNLNSVLVYTNNFLPELMKSWSTKDYSNIEKSLDSTFIKDRYSQLNTMFNAHTWNYIEITKINKTEVIGIDTEKNLISVYISGKKIDEVIFKTNFRKDQKIIPFFYILEFATVNNELILYNHIQNANSHFLSYIYRKFYSK